MDSALKEILREEKRRQRDRSDKKDRGRSDKKDKSDKHRDDRKDRDDRKEDKRREKSRSSRTNHRRHKSENDSKSIEFIPVQTEHVEHPEHPEHLEEPSDTRTVLMFLYEDADGKLYKQLDTVPKTTAKIFPVYVHGSHDNFTEEEIIYQDGKWTSDMEGSWLEYTTNDEYNILPFEGEKVVVYNEKLFHCEGDLLEYLQEFGPEVLEVN